MKMLNLQYRIVAAESELLSGHGFITLAYAPKADMIVLNDDCPSLNQVVEFIVTYLDLNAEEREETLTWSDCSKTLRGIMQFLDQVVEARNGKKAI